MSDQMGPVIKYIGSKRTLVPLVTSLIQSMSNTRSVLDLFSGTSRVGHALKSQGYRVTSNDHNKYAHTIAQCYVQADREDVASDVSLLIKDFNRLKGVEGYFTRTFCRKSKFFQPKNGRRVDAIRQAIEKKNLSPEVRAVVLISLMEAADRVDSTCGVQMAYLKQWAARAHKDLELRLPDCLPRARHGKGAALCLDASDAISSVSADVAYVDPPYNQHSYLSNYHIWETLVTWDNPESYGKACKRIDCRERKSPFNSKKRAHDALRHIIENIDARSIIVSFNNEGYISRDELTDLLETRGTVKVISRPYKRYVGAQIGIHDLAGKKVGKVSHLKNIEYVYVVETKTKRKRTSRRPPSRTHQEQPLIS